MPRDLTGTVTRLGQDYTVRRPGVPTYTQGHPVPAEGETFTARGVVSPAGRDAMQRLPEGDRTQAAVQFITTSEIRSAMPGEAPGDVLEFQGRDWECHAVAPWPVDGQFWDAVLVRVGQ